jgi:glycosyltransferase involved in cell wall biosynthesis
MPIAILEAMAAGCPVVASAVDGNRELIENGVHGWLVQPENPLALADAIQAALRDPGEARRRATAARERVSARFSEAAMVNAWEKLLTVPGTDSGVDPGCAAGSLGRTGKDSLSSMFRTQHEG